MPMCQVRELLPLAAVVAQSRESCPLPRADVYYPSEVDPLNLAL